MVDDYLQLMIVNKLKFLKKHPSIIDRIFYTGKRETLTSLKDFIKNKPIKVIIGYPKDQTSLPCYVITLAPENEVPLGLGDGTDEFIDYEKGLGGLMDEEEDATDGDSSVELSEEEELMERAISEMSVHLNGTYMNSTYRIECWSDNGDLTAYMYIILKWCLWTSRQEMLSMGWVNITLSGTDLEPVPDYMPVFVYRRSAQINLQYENLYFSNTSVITNYIDIIENPDDYYIDDDDNIRKKDDDTIVVESTYIWVIVPNYYSKKISVHSTQLEDWFVKDESGNWEMV